MGQNSSTAMWKTHCQFSQTLDCSCCCKGWQLLELLFHVGPSRFGQLFSLNKWNNLLRLSLCRANASTTVKRVHVYIEKTMQKHRNWIKTPVKNYYCMSNISCLHHGDRLKAAVHCFHRTFIVNSLLVLYLQKSERELLLNMFTRIRNLTWWQELPV